MLGDNEVNLLGSVGKFVNEIGLEQNGSKYNETGKEMEVKVYKR